LYDAFVLVKLLSGARFWKFSRNRLTVMKICQATLVPEPNFLGF